MSPQGECCITSHFYEWYLESGRSSNSVWYLSIMKTLSKRVCGVKVIYLIELACPTTLHYFWNRVTSVPHDLSACNHSDASTHRRASKHTRKERQRKFNAYTHIRSGHKQSFIETSTEFQQFCLKMLVFYLISIALSPTCGHLPITNTWKIYRSMLGFCDAMTWWKPWQRRPGYPGVWIRNRELSRHFYSLFKNDVNSLSAIYYKVL